MESRRDTDTVSRETQEIKGRISQLEQALKKRRRSQAKPENCEIQDLKGQLLEFEMPLKETSRRSGSSTLYQRESRPVLSVRIDATLLRVCPTDVGRKC